MNHLFRLLFALLFTINGAAAQSADAVFYMEMDTLGGGIRAGQEYDLYYKSAIPFDSVSPPVFDARIEVIKGPLPWRGSSYTLENGREKSTSGEGFRYRIRFAGEGAVELPAAGIKKGGREYVTPAAVVRILPAIGDPQEVACRIELRPEKPGPEEDFFITLTCSARPDSKEPTITASGLRCRPISSGSQVRNGEAQYTFTFLANAERGGKYVLRAENLTFGGKPYPLDHTLQIGRIRTAWIHDYGPLLAIGAGLLLEMLFLRLLFRRERKADFAAFVLRHKRIPLTTSWALTHYGIPFFLVNIPMFYWTAILSVEHPATREGSLWPDLGIGVFPLLLAALLIRRQYRKLFFTPVRTTLPPGELYPAIERLCQEHEWVPDHVGEECFVGHTPTGAFSWGEQLFIVFDKGRVWINSVGNMDRRVSVSSFGRIRRNKRLLQKAIEQTRS